MFDWKWGGHRAERPFHPRLNPPRKSLAAHGAGPLNFPEAVQPCAAAPDQFSPSGFGFGTMRWLSSCVP